MSNPKSFYATKYEGGNATIDRLHDGESDIWMVNGRKGRKVLLMPIGATNQEAKDEYVRRHGKKSD